MSMMQQMMGGSLGVTTMLTGSMRSDPYTAGPSSGNGYSPAYSAGSLSPNTFTALGRTLTVTAVLDTVSPGPTYQSYITISGFDPAIDPLNTFLYSVQWGSEFVYSRGLSGYGFVSGIATWTFSITSTPNFGLSAGGTNNLILKGFP